MSGRNNTQISWGLEDLEDLWKGTVCFWQPMNCLYEDVSYIIGDQNNALYLLSWVKISRWYRKSKKTLLKFHILFNRSLPPGESVSCFYFHLLDSLKFCISWVSRTNNLKAKENGFLVFYGLICILVVLLATTKLIWYYVTENCIHLTVFFSLLKFSSEKILPWKILPLKKFMS